MKRIPIYKCRYCGEFFEASKECGDYSLPISDFHQCFIGYIGIGDPVGFRLEKEEEDKEEKE